MTTKTEKQVTTVLAAKSRIAVTPDIPPHFTTGPGDVSPKLPLLQRIRAPTVPRAHTSPHAKRQLDRYRRFCTAHGCEDMVVATTEDQQQ